jgi:tRNA (guanosine-2'-O-)-methyltransferase
MGAICINKQEMSKMTAERQERFNSTLDKRQPDLVVVMENVNDPHNIFAIMRSCDSVGIQELFIVKTAFGTHRKFGDASSSGASKWLTIHHFDNAADCVAALRQRGLQLWAAQLQPDAVSVYDMDMTQPVALVFGNEQKGISPEMLQACTGHFIIPQVGMSKSLNVSVACAISVYEAFRQRNIKQLYSGQCRLPAAQREAIKALWEAPYEL